MSFTKWFWKVDIVATCGATVLWYLKHPRTWLLIRKVVFDEVEKQINTMKLGICQSELRIRRMRILNYQNPKCQFNRIIRVGFYLSKNISSESIRVYSTCKNYFPYSVHSMLHAVHSWKRESNKKRRKERSITSQYGRFFHCVLL